MILLVVLACPRTGGGCFDLTAAVFDDTFDGFDDGVWFAVQHAVVGPIDHDMFTSWVESRYQVLLGLGPRLSHGKNEKIKYVSIYQSVISDISKEDLL